MPDILENGSPWGDSNTSPDEHRNFIVEHVFGRRSIWPVDPKLGHLLAIL